MILEDSINYKLRLKIKIRNQGYLTRFREFDNKLL